MKQITISEARGTIFNLPTAMSGDPISIVRHGRPILVAMEPAVYAGIQATLGIYGDTPFRDRVLAGGLSLKRGKPATSADSKKRVGLPASSNNYQLRATKETLGTLERMKDTALRARLVETLGAVGDNPAGWLPLAHEFVGLYGVSLPNRYLAVISADSDRQIVVLGLGAIPAALVNGNGSVYEQGGK